MSLILEALKKSEQQRRLGEAPTLGSPVLVARKRRNLLPLLGVLIVAALAVGWWLTRTPDQEPAVTRTDTVASAPTPAGQTATPAKPAPAPHAPATRPPNANPATGAGSPPAANRTATAPAKPPVATTPAAQTPPAAAAPKTPAAPTAVPPAASTKPPALATPPAAPPATAAKPSADGKPATPNATVAPPAQPPAAARPASAPAQPSLPSVWDLPYATRKDLPELTLTMHVYAGEPSERFVVIKGERHVEGDDLGDGVALKEIRPDGLVLEFKGQRFVYPRDGR